jgi:hypothetical protein
MWLLETPVVVVVVRETAVNNRTYICGVRWCRSYMCNGRDGRCDFWLNTTRNRSAGVTHSHNLLSHAHLNRTRNNKMEDMMISNCIWRGAEPKLGVSDGSSPEFACEDESLFLNCWLARMLYFNASFQVLHCRIN